VFKKSKERRLATELGCIFMIGDPWITNALSPPWPFASESKCPSFSMPRHLSSMKGRNLKDTVPRRTVWLYWKERDEGQESWELAHAWVYVWWWLGGGALPTIYSHQKGKKQSYTHTRAFQDRLKFVCAKKVLCVYIDWYIFIILKFIAPAAKLV